MMATDIHIVLIPTPGGTVPTPLPHPFNGLLNGNLSSNVNVMGMAAATEGSTADNQPPHIPQGGQFQTPPANQGQITNCMATVKINGKPAARNGDMAMTCNDPKDIPVGKVIATGTVLIG